MVGTEPHIIVMVTQLRTGKSRRKRKVFFLSVYKHYKTHNVYTNKHKQTFAIEANWNKMNELIMTIFPEMNNDKYRVCVALFEMANGYSSVLAR